MMDAKEEKAGSGLSATTTSRVEEVASHFPKHKRRTRGRPSIEQEYQLRC